MSRIERVTVLGAGTMGHGIAQVSATSGYGTTLFDIDKAATDRGIERIRANLEKGVSLGKLTDDDREATLRRLGTSTAIDESVAHADLVIEAVPESLELKQSLFTEVEAHALEEALLATNTSSIGVAHIASVLERPNRFLGLHFFNPVHIMSLVEVVWGAETSDETCDAGVDFARSLGKEPIVVKDSPGFASSRLGVILGLEAIRMLEEGVASAHDIDRAMELGYRHPMGPLRLTDLIGLDVRLGIAEYLYRELGTEAFRPPKLMRRMVEEGRTGKKAGHGFYDWEDT